MENIYTYVQFVGMIYQQIVGIPMGTNCAPLIADFYPLAIALEGI